MGAFFLSLPLDGSPEELQSTVLDKVKAVLRVRTPAQANVKRLNHATVITLGKNCVLRESAGSFLVVDGSMSAYGNNNDALADCLLNGTPFDGELLDGRFAAVVVRSNPFSVQLLRDRFGTRPVYWALKGNVLLAASEVLPLSEAGVGMTVNKDVLASSMHFRWVLNEEHLFSPVSQVPAGHVTTLNANKTASSRRYWSLRFHPRPLAELDLAAAAKMTQAALVESLQKLSATSDSITILFSGGVDSSIIAAAAREAGLKTNAIIGDFPDSDNVELERALTVATYLDLKYEVVRVRVPSGDDFAQMIDRIEEIPRNPNNVVLAQLYEAASKHGGVVLNGDATGAFWGHAHSGQIRQFRAKRRFLDKLGVGPGWPGVGMLKYSKSGLMRRIARLCSHSAESYGSLLHSIQFSPEIGKLLDNISFSIPPFEPYSNELEFDDSLHIRQTRTFVITTMLRHDRLAESYGLKPLTPFTLPELISVAQSLPRELRYTTTDRTVLKEVCDRWLPREVSRWSKRGFEVSWQLWLKEPFKALTYPHPSDSLLPPGFATAAIAANDDEALWNVFSLRRLADHFQLY